MIAAVQGVFQEAGGRTIEVTNRDYQLRGVDRQRGPRQARVPGLGRAPDGAAGPPEGRRLPAGRLRPAAQHRRPRRHRRSRRRHRDHGAGPERAGGDAGARRRSWMQLRPTLPPGVEIVTTYDRSAWIWATLRQFFETLAVELVGADRRDAAVSAERPRRGRPDRHPAASACCSPPCRWSAFDQTINLFSLAGLCHRHRRDRGRDDRHRRELHGGAGAAPGCASRDEKQEILIHAIAAVTRPLLFSLLIILASFLPVFFLEEREARLFDPLAYSKTFAMAFSTLLTLFCCRSSCLDLQAGPAWRGAIFARAVAVRRVPVGSESRDPLPLCVHRGGPARPDSRRHPARDVSQGLHAGDRRRLDPLHADDAARAADPGSRLDSSADGQEAEGVSGGRAGVRQARPGRHVHRSGAGDDDRDDGAAEAEGEVAGGHDQGQAGRRDGPGDADGRLRQQLGAADPRARHDAEHRHPDAGRHQGQGPDVAGHRGRCRSRSRGCCADCRGTKSVIAERISEGYYVDVRTISSGWPSTA